MSLLRFAGRALFSSYFVADGYQMVTKPDKKSAEIAGPIDFCVPMAQSMLPPGVADKVPTDARVWTRVLGVAQIIGGVAYATGIARRPGAALLAAAFAPQVITAASDGDRSTLFSKLALLGGTLVATQDTAGRPGLAWKAQQSRKAAGQHAEQSRKVVEQRADAVGKDLKRAQKKAKTQATKAKAQAQQAAKELKAQVKDAVR